MIHKRTLQSLEFNRVTEVLASFCQSQSGAAMASGLLPFKTEEEVLEAQKLYEEGLITYMRTDSTNLSELALADIAKAITEDYGKPYLHTRRYHTKAKGAQEAHEAIRPTYISRRTISGTPQEQKLYDLIWKRAVASQMSDASLEKTNVDINMAGTPADSEALFRAEGETLKF